MPKIKGISLFSGGGIGETYLSETDVEIVVANELLVKRAEFYKQMHPTTKMISGDIKEKFDEVILIAKENDVKFLLATPPCQGMSSLGKKDYENDFRNYLVYYVIKAIEDLNLDYVLIENVPKFLKLWYPYNNGEFYHINEILKLRFGSDYEINTDVLNARDYGIPQSRPRSIITMHKRDLCWKLPDKERVVTLEEAIGDLPSLESGHTSSIKYHYSAVHSKMHIEVMKYTPTGCSAYQNEHHFPTKKNGDKVKGFHNTYKRMKWDEPAPTRALNNGAISGHNNVHPGRRLENGTYSDARALTLLELFIVSSLPRNWEYPESFSDNFIRQIIGEGVPPLFIKKLVNGIGGVKSV
jgi:DNA (cytosine-5)-methyltransferase 1